MTKRRKKNAEVIDLADAREEHRLSAYRRKITQVLESNRRAITRLFTTGALFTRAGSKAGRDLLLAHQHVLKVVTLLNQLADLDAIPAPRSPVEINAVYRELDLLLDRTSELTSRTGNYLARLQGE
ncbi:MAG: hypothetical protein ACT4TC_05115 [Myxococcaceae bacterium]